MSKPVVELLDRQTGDTYTAEGASITIGRAPGNTIVIKDSTISRKHAKIFFKNNAWYIKDLKSTNGTYVNGKRVQGEVKIYEHDVISLGNRVLIPITLSSTMEIDEKPRQDIKYITSILDIGDKRWEKVMEGIEEIGSELLVFSSTERILNKVAEAARNILNVERAFVIIRDRNRDRIAGMSIKEGVDVGTGISRSILKRAIEEKMGVITQDALSDERFSGERSVMMMGIRSALCVPIWKKDRVLGAIYVDSSIKNRIHTQEDMEVLSVLGNYVAIVLEQRRLMDELKTQQKMRERLEKYHSPSVVRRLFEHGLETTTLGRKFFTASGTILFADVVGFTSLVEESTPEEVGNLLNDFLSRMTDVVFKYEGTLDKYLGDGVMAVFGVPLKQEDHAERALKVALEMQNEVRNMRGEWPLKIRIGVNSGEMIAGDFGSEKRLEFTVIGHSVNLASRLQSEVAQPDQIAVGKTTYELTKDKFEFEYIGKVSVKGLKEPIDAYLLKEEKK